MEAVAPPRVPAASAPCGFDAGALCNSDAEAAALIAAYDEALAEANRRLAWIAGFFGVGEGAGGKSRSPDAR